MTDGASGGATVRRAAAEDAAAVAGIEERNLGTDAWSPGLVAQGVAGEVPHAVYLVAEVGGEAVGYAAASLVQDIAELQRIAVDEAHRRHGLATALLDAVVEEATAAGAGRLLIEVREDNTGALAFYARSGFEELARRARYYRDGATAVVMSHALTGPAVKVWTTS